MREHWFEEDSEFDEVIQALTDKWEVPVVTVNTPRLTTEQRRTWRTRLVEVGFTRRGFTTDSNRNGMYREFWGLQSDAVGGISQAIVLNWAPKLPEINQFFVRNNAVYTGGSIVHSFLSNFFVHPFAMDGHVFQSGEHAFQFGKAVTREDQEYILLAHSPGEAKRRGRKVAIHQDWDDRKIAWMRRVLYHKFLVPELREQLLKTGDAWLQEGNYWHDEFWGVNLDTDQGQNWLGLLLMELRSLLQGHSGEVFKLSY